MKQFLYFAYSLINYFRILKVFSFLFLWMIKLCSDSLYILASPWQQRGVLVESVHFGKIKKSRSFANKKTITRMLSLVDPFIFLSYESGFENFRGINNQFLSINLSLFRFLRIDSNWNQGKTSKLEVKDCFGKQ